MSPISKCHVILRLRRPSDWFSSNCCFGKLTSIKQKLGMISSPPPGPAPQPVENAPVALPGLTKNFPSNSYASNLCVPPHNKTSTSICLAAISRLSGSPCGIMVWPWVRPIRRLPCATTLDKGVFAGMADEEWSADTLRSNGPRTSCRSGAKPRRKSNVLASVRFPRQRTWPIFPGVKSFLNC